MVGFGISDVDPERAKKGRPSFLFKVILVGGGEIGKTAALTKFIQDSFDPQYESTQGLDFTVKPVQIGGDLVKLQIWDTPGHDEYRTFTYTYYRGTQGIVLFFDLTNRESLENVRGWNKEVRSLCPKDVSKIMVGTKADLKDDRKVDEKEIQDLAEELGVDFLEISSKTGEGIDRMFEMIVEKMILAKKDKYANLPSTSTMGKSVGVKHPQSQNKSKSCVIL